MCTCSTTNFMLACDPLTKTSRKVGSSYQHNNTYIMRKMNQAQWLSVVLLHEMLVCWLSLNCFLCDLMGQHTKSCNLSVAWLSRVRNARRLFHLVPSHSTSWDMFLLQEFLVITGGRHFAGNVALACLHCGVGPCGDVTSFDRRIIMWQFPPQCYQVELPKVKIMTKENYKERR